MKALTIRNIDDEVFEKFARRAKENERNPEAHARFLIQLESQSAPLETCGEILDAMTAAPPPAVDVSDIENYLNQRGRRSNRP